MSLLGHGVGSRSDLPLPLSFFAWAAVAMLVISFAALSALWREPKLAKAAHGREIVVVGRWLRLVGFVGAVTSMGLFLATWVAAVTGPDDAGANAAGFTVYVWLWVGMQFVALLLGNVWAVVNPLRWIAAGFARLRLVGTAQLPGWAPWLAPLLLFGFHLLELAHHDPGAPRVLFGAMAVYVVVVIVPCLRYGASWQRETDGLARWFSLLGRLGPVTIRDGRLRLRAPLSGLATPEVHEDANDGRPNFGLSATELAMVIVVVGGTGFDGFSRTDVWSDVIGDRVGWDATVVRTVGLTWSIAVIAAVYAGAVRWSRRQISDPDTDPAAQPDTDETSLALAFAPSMVPIAAGYTVAHYFSLLVFESQSGARAWGDPFTQGWNLLGLADRPTDYLVVSTTVIATVQAVAIIAGHLAGTVVAHDVALTRFDDPDRALRSQFPMLATMIVLTLVALGLVVSA